MPTELLIYGIVLTTLITAILVLWTGHWHANEYWDDTIIDTYTISCSWLILVGLIIPIGYYIYYLYYYLDRFQVIIPWLNELVLLVMYELILGIILLYFNWRITMQPEMVKYRTIFRNTYIFSYEAINKLIVLPGIAIFRVNHHWFCFCPNINGSENFIEQIKQHLI